MENNKEIIFQEKHKIIHKNSSPKISICFNQISEFGAHLFLITGSTQSLLFYTNKENENFTLFSRFRNYENLPFSLGKNLTKGIFICPSSNESLSKYQDILIALGGEEPNIQIVSITEKKVINVLSRHKEEITSIIYWNSNIEIQFKNNKKLKAKDTLLSCSKEGVICLWDLCSMQLSYYLDLDKLDDQLKHKFLSQNIFFTSICWIEYNNPKLNKDKVSLNNPKSSDTENIISKSYFVTGDSYGQLILWNTDFFTFSSDSKISPEIQLQLENPIQNLHWIQKNLVLFSSFDSIYIWDVFKKQLKFKQKIYQEEKSDFDCLKTIGLSFDHKFLSIQTSPFIVTIFELIFQKEKKLSESNQKFHFQKNESLNKMKLEIFIKKKFDIFLEKKFSDNFVSSAFSLDGNELVICCQRSAKHFEKKLN
ncbi:wdr41-related [Anaeramoeba ignava]|uniref:Wdr41-related n=1 Tax=Anaeramoeba ignava TaxID=1746090 RepID=A0A9Q0LCJ9_ANAIG|nr:wdr41-related [Anaeramoeba ignava]